VPGKYLGGTPISVREAKLLFLEGHLENIPKLLVGPWARFGCTVQGGRAATESVQMSPPFDYIVKGDAEIIIGNVLSSSSDFSQVDLNATRQSAEEIEEYAVRGAQIARQAQGFSRGHLICEVETYRGCPRYVTGGCSFCTEPLYGTPQQRTSESIAREIEALYRVGARAFRLGRQADLFSYGSKGMGEIEFPRPNTEAIEALFRRIRHVAPELTVLHIDNVNPGTVARYPEESKAVATAIMKYHTTGDVAAFGVESADPEVIRRNNLKVTSDEALEAVRVLNEVGTVRPQNELPHLLPGLNFVYGLPGESEKTIDYNTEFLETILRENLLVRRINIRQVISFPGTRVAQSGRNRLRHGDFLRHKQDVRQRIDLEMLKRVAPSGTVIRSVFLEGQEGNYALMRPLASYPLLCQMPASGDASEVSDVFVVNHGPRSVSVLPFPLKANSATMAQWASIPGIGSKRAARLRKAPVHSLGKAETVLDMKMPDWLARSLEF
jgi:radical SAM superfamily enzyme with C-terminal helix-hairpin-helix motif